MNIKLFSIPALSVGLVIGLVVLSSGCKDDDNPTTPQGPVAPYGSGTITAMSSAGPLSISGTGAYPLQAGPSVLAMYDTSIGIGVFIVYGYQQVSGSNYNVIALAAVMSMRVDTGTYLHPQIAIGAGYNVDTTHHADSLVYQSVSGSITISSVNGSHAVGMYSVMAKKGVASPIQFTGTFDVNYVVGVMPDRDSPSTLKPIRQHIRR